MNIEDYKSKFTDEDAVGWLSIDSALEKIYGKTEPRHYGPPCGIHYIAGGTDPIDGVSIFDSKSQSPHLHLVSYGMSELYYSEEACEDEISKWGFEFTMRLTPFKDDPGDPFWIIQMMNNLARYVFSSGRWFEENHFVPANSPIRLETKTEITGLVFALDPELGKIETPHGPVEFLQMVGITSKEVERLKQNPGPDEVEKLISELRKENPLLITDLNRK